MASFGPLVQADWLRQNLGDGDLLVVDFRWYLDGRSGRAAYEAGHVPGAVFLDLLDVTGADGGGRHPLPGRDQFEQALRLAGVNSSDRVVAYDDASGSVAARLWWLLRWFGHPAAAILDGGIQAWGEPLETGLTPARAGSFAAVDPDPAQVLGYEAVSRRPAGAVLIDARAPERYSGATEPIDPRAGHIPGAINVFWKSCIAQDGRLLSPAQLRQHFAGLGIASGDSVVAYCGSGVTACSDLLALEVAGLPGGRLYAGSWSDWSSREDAPAATGDQP